MARQYSPKTFLRKAPNKLLKKYLAKHNVGTDLQWEHLAETDIDLAFEAMENAPEPARREIDGRVAALYGL